MWDTYRAFTGAEWRQIIYVFYPETLVFRNKEAIQTQRPERYESPEGSDELKKRRDTKEIDSVEHIENM